jgi:hypothetical protein
MMIDSPISGAKKGRRSLPSAARAVRRPPRLRTSLRDALRHGSHHNSTACRDALCFVSASARAPTPTKHPALRLRGGRRTPLDRYRGLDFLCSFLALGAVVEVARIDSEGLAIDRGKAGQDLTKAFKKRLAAVDEDAIYREMVNLKRQQRWWNLAFDRSAIRAALHSDRYEIFGLPSVLELRSGADLARLHRVAVTLVRRLFEKAYRKQEAGGCRYGLIRAEESGIPKTYYKEIRE